MHVRAHLRLDNAVVLFVQNCLVEPIALCRRILNAEAGLVLLENSLRHIPTRLLKCCGSSLGTDPFGLVLPRGHAPAFVAHSHAVPLIVVLDLRIEGLKVLTKHPLSGFLPYAHFGIATVQRRQLFIIFIRGFRLVKTGSSARF